MHCTYKVIACVKRRYMVKFNASAKFAVGTKIDLKFIFQCGIGVYNKRNEEKNVIHLFIQYLKRCTLLAEIGILPSSPL